MSYSKRREFFRSAPILSRAAKHVCETLETRQMLCSIPIEHREDIPNLVEDAWIKGDTKTTNYYDGDYKLLYSNVEPWSPPASQPKAQQAATISWINRGVTSGTDDDRFDLVFGANSNSARSVIDASIEMWRRVVGNFNYSDGSSGFNLTMKMASTGTSNGASASVSSWLNGKPKAGAITMGRGGGGTGGGWFIDPTPFDHSEFMGNIQNAFAADAPAGSPANGLGDFLTVANAEMAHTMGLYFAPSSWNGFNIDTNVNDAAGGATGADLYRFNGTSIQHLTTEFDSGGGATGQAVHTAEPQNYTTGGVTYNGTNDAGNAYYEFSRRYLVPEDLRLMFNESLGYSTQPAAKFGSMYTVLNQSTGRLTIRGGDTHTANSIDRITINNSAGILSVTVDPLVDVAGSGSLPGAGNLPGWTSEFASASVTSIVIDTGGGDDVITINGLGSGMPTTINSGSGNDSVELAASTRNLDNVSGAIVLDGGSEDDSITLFDDVPNFDDTYSISSNSVTKPFAGTFGGLTYFGTDKIVIGATQGDNVFSINSTTANIRYELYGNNGNDQFYVGGFGGGDLDTLIPPSTIDGKDLVLFGQGGTSDQIYINDTGETSADAWLINADFAQNYSSNSLSTPTTGEIWNDLNCEFLRFNGGNLASTFVRSDWTAANASTTFNMNGGNDEVWLGWNGGNLADIQGNVSVIGGTGVDKVVAWDDLQNDANVHIILSGEFIHAGAGQIRHSSIENLELNTGNGVNQVFVNSLSNGQSLTVNTNDGDDDLWLANSTGNVSNLGAATVTFNGGSDFDEAFFDDDDQSETASYTINSSSVTRSGGATLQYQGTDRIAIFAPNGANAFNLNSTVQNVRYEIFANGGDDTLNVGNDLDTNFPVETIPGQVVQFYGQAGIDSVNINDSADTNADGAVGGADYQDVRFDVTRKYASPGGAATSTEIRFSEHEFITYTGAGHRTVMDLRQSLIPTTVNAGGGDDQISIGDGNLVGNVTVSPTINGEAGNDSMTLFDAGVSTTGNYGLSASTVSRSGAANVNFGTVEAVTVDCSQGVNDIQMDSIGYAASVFGNNSADTFNLNSKSNVPTTLGGGDGDDIFFFAGAGSPNLDLLTGPTTVLGDAGNDHLVARDSGSVDPDAYTIVASSLSRNGTGLVTYSSLSEFQLESSRGATPILINATASGTQYNIYGSNGADSIFLGNGNIDLNLLGNVTIDGGDDTDSVTFNDTSAAVGGTYSFGNAGVSKGLRTFNFAAERMTLNASNLGDSVNFNSTDTSTTYRLNTSGGADSIAIGSAAGGQVVTTVDGGAGLDTLTVNQDAAGAAFVRFVNAQDYGSISIGTGGNVYFDGLSDGLANLRTGSLVISSDGKLTLNDNAMVVDYSVTSPLVTFEGYIRDGRLAPGVNSLGAVDADATIGSGEASTRFTTFPATFAGTSVDSTTVLLRYVKKGDANLDRLVNFDDLLIIAQSYGQSGRSFGQGNFDYSIDRTVNFSDLLILAQQYGRALFSTTSGRSLWQSLPEELA